MSMPSIPEYNGWPYLTAENWLRQLDAYSQPLAQKLYAALGAGPPAGGSVIDTGWLACSTNTGYTEYLSPSARRIGSAVYLKGGWASSGLTANTAHNVGVIPAGCRPGYQVVIAAGTSSGTNPAACVVVSASGVVQVRVGPSVPPVVVLDGVSWLIP